MEKHEGIEAQKRVKMATESGAIEMQAVLGEHIGTAEKEMLAFLLTSVPDEGWQHGKRFEASIPSRHIVWQENSAPRAVAALLYGVAKLAQEGALDPDEPDRKGKPPIQHVIGVLTDRLAWHVEARRRGCEGEPGGDFKPDAHQPSPADDATKQWLGRNSEVIAALGTAISALARIKDL